MAASVFRAASPAPAPELTIMVGGTVM